MKDGDHRPSVSPEQPYLLDGGEEERRREPKENEAVDRLDRAKQPPAILEVDVGMPEAGDRFERIQHRGRPRGQGAKPEVENRPGGRFDRQIYRRGERGERNKDDEVRRLVCGRASKPPEHLCCPEYRCYVRYDCQNEERQSP
jgi:hypothetical protein